MVCTRPKTEGPPPEDVFDTFPYKSIIKKRTTGKNAAQRSVVQAVGLSLFFGHHFLILFILILFFHLLVIFPLPTHIL